MSRSAITAMAACLLAAWAARVAPARAGESTRALRLVSPIRAGETVEGGWMLADVEEHPEYLHYTFAHEEHACSVLFEVTTHNALHPGLYPLERHSLFIVGNTCEGMPADLVRLVGGLIAGNEHAGGGPDLRPPHASSETTGILGFVGTLCPLLLFLGLVLLATAFARRDVRAAAFASPSDPVDRLDAIAPCAGTLAAAAVRFLDAPLSITNVNAHAYDWVQVAMDGIVGGYGPYGNGYPGFMHLFFLAGLPRTAETIMVVNATLGALSVPAIWALGRALTGSRWAAAFVALAWALLPAHVRFSASEDFPALLAFGQILAILACVVAARAPRPITLAAAASLALFSVQVRPEGWVLLPVCAAVFAIVAGRRTLASLARTPWTWIVLAAALLVAAGPLVHLLHTLGGDSGAHRSIDPLSARSLRALLFEPLGSAEGIGNLTLNPLVSPPTIPLLALVGLLAAPRHHRPLAIALAASWLAFALPVVGFQLGLLPTIRLQVAYQWTAVLLAGIGCAALLARLPDRFSRWIPVAIVVVALASYLPYRKLVRHLWAPQHEYAFLTKAMERIPDGCTLVHLDGEVDDVATRLPRWIPARRGSRIRYVPASTFLDEAPPPAETCVYWYRGITCFAWTDGAEGPLERPLCARMDGIATRPVVTREIPAESAGSHTYRAGTLPIGLWRIE